MIDLIRSRWIFAVPLVSAVAIFILMVQTSPQSVGPAGILLVFLLLYLFFASCLFIILHTGESIVRKLVGNDRVKRLPRWSLEVRRAYYVASVVAFVPVALLAMQSLGQLQVTDILLVAALAGLLSFYTLRMSP